MKTWSPKEDPESEPGSIMATRGPWMGIRDPLVHQCDAPESTFFVLHPSVTEGSAVPSWSSCSKWLFHICHCQLLSGTRVRSLYSSLLTHSWIHGYFGHIMAFTRFRSRGRVPYGS